jgi:hypothetical protein
MGWMSKTGRRGKTDGDRFKGGNELRSMKLSRGGLKILKR